MSFPVITGFNSKISAKIEDTSKISYLGAKPYIQLTNYIDASIPGGVTIRNDGYDDYSANPLGTSPTGLNKADWRFPAVITSLSVGVAGNLGTLRKAKINIKFSSMSQLTSTAYQNFLVIGRVQCVSWGWVREGLIGHHITNTEVKGIVNNIAAYQKLCADVGYEQDFLAGILTNFEIKLNSDATIDVQIELSSPSDIPAYMSSRRNDSHDSLESAGEGGGLEDICKALNLEATIRNINQDDVKYHSVNYDASWMTGTPGETNDAYIQLGFALETIFRSMRVRSTDATNEKNMLEHGIDLSQAIGAGHIYMLSCNENIIFPNRYATGFNDGLTPEGNRKIELDTSVDNGIGPINAYRKTEGKDNALDTIGAHSDGGDEYPHPGSVKISVPVEGSMQTITFDNLSSPNNIWVGYVKSIYVRTKFLVEASKGCNVVTDLVQKILDEINNASCGLTNLIIKTFTNSSGKEVLSIVDLNLQTNNPTIPTLKIFNENSRIIDLSLNTNLPKEIIGQVVLGKGNEGDNHDDTTGLRFFNAPKGGDRMLVVEDATGFTKPPAPPPPPPNAEPLWWTLSKIFFQVSLKASASLGNRLFNGFLNFVGAAGPLRIKMGNSSDDKWLGTPGSKYVVYKNVDALKTLYFGKQKFIRQDALIPATLSVTILGLSGITIGTTVKFDPNPAPWLGDDGMWQVTNVEHKVEQDKWETIIEFKFRVGNTIK